VQSIAPANLNRDETGSPKDCVFGGVRRARISSQALKRAARARFPELIAEREADLDLGVRTRLAAEEIARILHERHGRDREEAASVANAALSALKKRGGEGGDYLLFLSRTAMEAFADRCDELFEKLTADRPSVSDEEKKRLKEALLSSERMLDIALFGRMVADLPEGNIDAATQVAHAISTHEVRPDFDYFTAVDDLQPPEETGAGHLDVLEFNSACYYRYASVDSEQLRRNLGGESDLAVVGIEVFLEGLIRELPRGKQHAMAAYNPPSLMLAAARERGQWNLANAFEDPVRAEGGYLRPSVERLLGYYERLTKVYEHLRPERGWLVLVEPRDGTRVPDGIEELATAKQLVEAVSTFLRGRGA
jgi:CRISPR system Cascade subunit CasC